MFSDNFDNVSTITINSTNTVHDEGMGLFDEEQSNKPLDNINSRLVFCIILYDWSYSFLFCFVFFSGNLINNNTVNEVEQSSGQVESKEPLDTNSRFVYLFMSIMH